MSNETIKYYNENANEFIDSTVSADVSELFEFFLKHIKPGSRILDLGCGSGRDSKFFIEKGFEVTATDGSEAMCEAASVLIKQDVECKLFTDIDYEDEFDAVWACSSILHLNKTDLIEVLRKVEKALVPGGVLYASFKYGNFSGMRNKRYFTDLTEESFRKLIDQISGLDLIKTIITSDVRASRKNEKWLNVLVKKV